MQSVGSIVAAVVVALALGVGLLALELHGPAKGASLGAAVAVAAIAAFLLAYDVLKRQESDAEKPARGREPGGGSAPVRPNFDPDDVLYVDAAARGGIEHMNEALRDRRRDVVYVFRIRLKPRNRYELQALSEQLAMLTQQIHPKTFVYLLTQEDRFVCFAEADMILGLLRDPKGLGLLDLINGGLGDEIKEAFGELNAFQLSRKCSSRDALGQMALKNKPLAMIVHEKHGKPIGPVDWATLATRVLRAK